MSRFRAALGSTLGLVGGGMVGTYVGHSLSPKRRRKVRRIGGAPPSQSLGAIGALSGAAIGAVVGAGSGGGTTPGALGELPMTPAEASNPGNFVTDVPVQGPTDEGMRAGDCWWAQNRTQHPSCVDCSGPIPGWATRTGVSGMESIAFNGRGFTGFGAPGDPEIYSGLSADKQAWIANTLATLNGIIVKTTGTTCATWAPAIPAATGCFQGWFNSANFGFKNKSGGPLVLRTDGVFDQDTLDVLRTVAALMPKDFPTPFPGTTLPGPVKEEKKLSKGAMFGIAAGGAVVLGGIAYVATHKKSRRRRR